MPWGPSGVATAARVDIVTSDNVTLEDAYQFDPPPMTGCAPPPYWPCGATGPTWGFTGNFFQMDVKGNRGQTGPLLSVWGPTGGSNMIQVQDQTNRILNFNVPPKVLTGAITGTTGATGIGLLPGRYLYDFLMIQPGTPDIVTMLMQGTLTVQHGVTEEGD